MKTEQCKNKTLDMPVNIGVTLCQLQLNPMLLTEHSKFRGDLNELTKKSRHTGTQSDTHSEHLCVVWLCVRSVCAYLPPPWNYILVSEVGLSNRVLKAEVDASAKRPTPHKNRSGFTRLVAGLIQCCGKKRLIQKFQPEAAEKNWPLTIPQMYSLPPSMHNLSLSVIPSNSSIFAPHK